MLRSSQSSFVLLGRTRAGGYLRIVGELRKLGVVVSATNVRNVLRRHRLKPAPRRSGPTWTEFLRAQAGGTLACGSWVTQRARNLTMTLEDEGRAVNFSIRDRDTKFVGPFDEVLRSIGSRVIKTPVRAPRANASAERFVRTARRECLDWLVIRYERHLERVFIEFVEHYNAAPPHRGIDLGAPIPYVPDKPLDDSMNIQRVGRLGGVLREYSIAA
jgi:putative transposase